MKRGEEDEGFEELRGMEEMAGENSKEATVRWVRNVQVERLGVWEV